MVLPQVVEDRLSRSLQRGSVARQKRSAHTSVLAERAERRAHQVRVTLQLRAEEAPNRQSIPGANLFEMVLLRQVEHDRIKREERSQRECEQAEKAAAEAGTLSHQK